VGLPAQSIGRSTVEMEPTRYVVNQAMSLTQSPIDPPCEKPFLSNGRGKGATPKIASAYLVARYRERPVPPAAASAIGIFFDPVENDRYAWSYTLAATHPQGSEFSYDNAQCGIRAASPSY